MRPHLSTLGLLLACAFAVAACAADDGGTAPASTVPTAAPTSTAAVASNGSEPAAIPEGALTRGTVTTSSGVTVDYVLLVPPGRTVGDEGKVLFAFPPGGQDIDLAQRIVEDLWAAEALARNWVVFSPAAPSTGLFFSDDSAALVPELLDHLAGQYPPEGGRFDLAGVSNGGLSAFRAALEHPDRFRSLVVFPGYSPDGGDDPALDRLEGIGVAMFVGAEDTGWLTPSQQTDAILKGMGATVELHVVPGEGHIIGSLTGTDLFDAMERVRG